MIQIFVTQLFYLSSKVPGTKANQWTKMYNSNSIAFCITLHVSDRICMRVGLHWKWNLHNHLAKLFPAPILASSLSSAKPGLHDSHPRPPSWAAGWRHGRIEGRTGRQELSSCSLKLLLAELWERRRLSPLTYVFLQGLLSVLSKGADEGLYRRRTTSFKICVSPERSWQARLSDALAHAWKYEGGMIVSQQCVVEVRWCQADLLSSHIDVVHAQSFYWQC